MNTRFPDRDTCIAPLPPIQESGPIGDTLAAIVDKSGPFAIRALGMCVNAVARLRGYEPIHPERASKTVD